MRYTVALTGGIGSGKSTVADAFADLEYRHRRDYRAPDG